MTQNTNDGFNKALESALQQKDTALMALEKIFPRLKVDRDEIHILNLLSLIGKQTWFKGAPKIRIAYLEPGRCCVELWDQLAGQPEPLQSYEVSAELTRLRSAAQRNPSQLAPLQLETVVEGSTEIVLTGNGRVVAPKAPEPNLRDRRDAYTYLEATLSTFIPGKHEAQLLGLIGRLGQQPWFDGIPEIHLKQVQGTDCVLSLYTADGDILEHHRNFRFKLNFDACLGLALHAKLAFAPMNLISFDQLTVNEMVFRGKALEGEIPTDMVDSIRPDRISQVVISDADLNTIFAAEEAPTKPSQHDPRADFEDEKPTAPAGDILGRVTLSKMQPMKKPSPTDKN